MGNKIYESVVAKLITKVPLLAKPLVNLGLEKMGVNPFQVTASQMSQVIKTYVAPKLENLNIDNLGGGIIQTDASDQVIYISPIVLNQYFPELKKADIRSGGTFESLRKRGFVIPRTELTEESTFRTIQMNFRNRVLTVSFLPVFDAKGERAGHISYIRDETLREELSSEVDHLYVQLQESQRELEKYTTNLEALVEEKNRDLIASEKKYRELFDTVQDPIFIVDGSRKLVDANDAAVLLFGFTNKKELLDTNLEHTYEDPDERENIFRTLMERGFLREHEIRLKRKDGRILTVLETSTVQKDRDGKLIRYYGILRDVTEKKKLETDLRQSEEKYRQFIRLMRDAIVILQDERIVFANEALEEISGFSLAELVGKPLVDLVDMVSRDEVTASYRNRMNQTGSELFEFKLVDKKGQVHDIETHSVSLEYQGKPAVMSILRDISEKRRLEQELIQAQKMKSIGILAGGIAHDFNNLLTSILPNAEMIKEKLDPSQPLYHYAESIEQASHRAAALVRQLLTFSRTGKPRLVVCNVNDLIGETIKLLDRLLEKTVEIRTLLYPGLMNIEADETQVEQVLVNLTINAKDAMPSGGELVFTTENITVTEEVDAAYGIRPGNYIRILVRDTGTGIPPEYRSKIFEPFFSTKEIGKGTGLGLAVVYGIVKNHNGYIDFSSTVGTGTEFRILLPAVNKPKTVVETQTITAPARKRETILVVDDEETIRKLTAQILSHQGYHTLQAGNGLEALEIYQNPPEPIDLVLLDMLMPRLNGKETFLRLRALNPQVRIAFVTGFSQDEAFTDFLTQSNIPIIQKPFTVNGLTQVVKQILEKK